MCLDFLGKNSILSLLSSSIYIFYFVKYCQREHSNKGLTAVSQYLLSVKYCWKRLSPNHQSQDFNYYDLIYCCLTISMIGTWFVWLESLCISSLCTYRLLAKRFTHKIFVPKTTYIANFYFNYHCKLEHIIINKKCYFNFM